ncbi:hypothetical protein MD484_g2789, partial [Candolleomyces efflorescens]
MFAKGKKIIRETQNAASLTTGGYDDSGYGGGHGHGHGRHQDYNNQDYGYDDRPRGGGGGGGFTKKRIAPSEPSPHVIFLGLDPDFTEADVRRLS